MYEIKTIYKDSDGTLHEEITTHATKDSYTNRIELIRSWYNTNMVAGYIGREIKTLEKEGVIL